MSRWNDPEWLERIDRNRPVKVIVGALLGALALIWVVLRGY